MADIASGLPIRTQLPGQVAYDDVVVKIGDGTTPSQLLAVDSAGLIGSKLYDGAGSAITSQVSGAQQALDVGINVAGVQIDPRSIRTLTSADIVTAEQGTSPWVISGTVAATQSGTWTVGLSEDHNYGTVGTTTLRVASQIGNATGSADFNFGSASAQTLRAAALIGNATGAADFNYGTVGAQTLRAAAQLGNATGAADYANGVTGAQTLRVAANLAIGGANVSATNPIPVQFSAAPSGAPVNDYNTSSALAAGASSNHDYTITASKVFQGKKVWGTASGLMRIEVQTSPDGTTFSTLWVGFNSTATPNIAIDLDEMVFLDSGTGAEIRVIRTNLDKKPMDVYSTISGVEV